MNNYTFDEIELGQKESFSAVITEEMMKSFLSITGDTNPLHNDAEYAKTEGFGERVVYGMLTASFLSTLAGVWLPGKYSLIHTVETEFAKPVHIGDTLTIEGEVTEKNDTFRYIKLKVSIRNQNGTRVCRGKMRIGLLK